MLSSFNLTQISKNASQIWKSQIVLFGSHWFYWSNLLFLKLISFFLSLIAEEKRSEDHSLILSELSIWSDYPWQTRPRRSSSTPTLASVFPFLLPILLRIHHPWRFFSLKFDRDLNCLPLFILDFTNLSVKQLGFYSTEVGRSRWTVILLMNFYFSRWCYGNFSGFTIARSRGAWINDYFW